MPREVVAFDAQRIAARPAPIENGGQIQHALNVVLRRRLKAGCLLALILGHAPLRKEQIANIAESGKVRITAIECRFKLLFCGKCAKLALREAFNMLLEFRLQNFRVFREEATLSLIASSDQALLEENTRPTGIAGAQRMVKTAAVYGPNAGGKTTLLRAMQLMRGVVLESAALKPGQTFTVQPFRLAAASKEEPTLFEVTLVLEGVRHQYGFTFTPRRIMSEWLLVFPKSRPQTWINRTYDATTDIETFEFSAHLSGPKKVWQDATRPNALFLSTAIQLNSDSLQPLFKWFASALNVFLDGGHIPFDFSTSMIEREKDRTAITGMLNAADIGIHSIAVERKKGYSAQFSINPTTGEAVTMTAEQEALLPKLRHVAGSITDDFDYPDESQGTQKLFALAGPILDIIDNGYTLVIDELDRSLHPLLVRQIVKTFQDPTINTKGAQLIFSTHDTSLLDAMLLRRDQIWFAEKRETQASTLTPLSDFSARKNEAFERGYLTGRYGGIPVLDGLIAPTNKYATR